MTTHKEALTLAVARLEWFVDTYPHDIAVSKEEFLRPFKEALAQPEHEPFVGLTLDERLELAQDVDWAAGAYCEYAEKIEAKLKEKNTK